MSDTSMGRSGPLAGAGGDPEVIETLGLAASHRWRRRLVKLGLVVALLTVVGVFVGRCVAARLRPKPARFEVRAAVVGDLSVEVTATGTIEAVNTVEVGAEVTGRLLHVHVDYNDAVEIGQLLAEIDPEQYQAAAEQAQAGLTSADAAVQQAQATLREARAAAQRATLEHDKGIASQREVEATTAAFERARAGVAAAQAQADIQRANLRSAATKLKRTRIVSPIRGMVLARLVSEGQTVTAGFQTPVLFKLAEDLRQMRLHVLVDEADVGRVREKATATFTVDAYSERSFDSTVLSLRNEPRTSQNVVSYEALLSVDNGELLLKPGMTATASIVCEARSGVLLVPNAALRFTPPAAPGGGMFAGPPRQSDKSTGPRVWVLEGDVPKPVAVKTGASDGERTEITEGELEAGTEVLTDVSDLPAGAAP
ncbi:MAG: efflux RND transporter periplasmic adaptor subunit [Polyangiaceae bacterium]|nr:efflux RND transporter periplasmic adaptor subunit [Polyangiaceae bacterium]